MNCKVEQIMVHPVVATTRHKTALYARELMARHRINALPVVDDDNRPIGIVTSSDLMNGVNNETRLDQVMTREVLSIIQDLPYPMVGADIVELNPHRDINDLTAGVAAKLLKEILANMLDQPVNRPDEEE